MFIFDQFYFILKPWEFETITIWLKNILLMRNNINHERK